MLKLMLKLIRKDGRGVKAPAVLAPPNLLVRLGRVSRGYVTAMTGVAVAFVAVVSLLTWVAPDSDKPIPHPIEVVDRVLPGVLQQVDEQVATLLGVSRETVVRNVREGLVAVGSGIGRVASASNSVAPSPAILPMSSTSIPMLEGPSQTMNEESPLQARREPSPTETSEPSAPATEALPPTASEPPPATEEPPPTEQPPTPPSTEEPPPPTEELPPTEQPPTPPSTEEPPPTTEEPPAPSTEEPPAPPSTEEPPPTTEQPPVTEVSLPTTGKLPPATGQPSPPLTDT
jgi:hypothetical protein